MPATKPTKRVSFRNVLFASDFSNSANAAMPFAGAIAKTFAAKLFALHVQEPVNYALPPESWQVEKTTREMEAQCLRETAQRDFPETKPTMLEAEGSVAAAVTAAVQEHHIDLIVVGTRGRTGIGKALLGSKAEEILRQATCPVLTVGPGATASNGPVGHFQNILFATNFGRASLAVAPTVISLAEEFQASLTLLHVVGKNDRYEGAKQEEVTGDIEQRLRGLIPSEAEAWCAPHFAVVHGDVAEKILEVARRMGADLIVLGAAGPEGMITAATHLGGGTVHHVVSHAACPVLTYREAR